MRFFVNKILGGTVLHNSVYKPSVSISSSHSGLIRKITNMKVIAVFAAVLAVALAAPQRNPDAEAQVLRNDLDNIGVDGYNFAYETSNGIAAQEQGQLINPGHENESIAVRGSFQYVGPDGVTYQVTYIADDNGFQPQGAHLPVAPQ
ncbi:flexible cuticle protein 12-like [Aethina tumida]|uniref:flexible cuticle protein 12-like n=1 Tax=Aethina tumida TaxID=116153 RepID=UPI0021491C6B|nr:flexible cuticle protein 12-like [Aethina tumida]